MFSNKDGSRRRYKKILFGLLLALLVVSLVVQTNTLTLKENQKKDGSNNNIFSTNMKLQSTDPSDFISTWNTNEPGVSNSSQIHLPLQSTGTYNFTVNWGDGSNSTITSYNQPEVTHTYNSPGIYTVIINGTIKGWYFNNAGDAQKIIEISQWGSLNLGNSGYNFFGASNLNLTATDAPDLNGTSTLAYAFQNCYDLGNAGSMNGWDVSHVTNMEGMFFDASSFNQSIDSWNVSHVTTMFEMFYQASSFNQPLGSWNVSAVTTMRSMFQYSSFNQLIDSWDGSHVTTTAFMFYQDSSFNQPIDSWNVSAVTDMSYMFYYASNFNQSLNSWDVSHVTNMEDMFALASSFNQSIGSWNVSHVTTMVDMFFDASSFNQPLDSWNISHVTIMYEIFDEASTFNQPIGSWDVSHVTNLGDMFFDASSFNQPLGSWNVSDVTDMQEMFMEATAFDQPIGSWNVSHVTTMNFMFAGATAFDQPIGSWNVSDVTDMQSMFTSAGLSLQNYNNLLTDWSHLHLQGYVPFDAGSSQYSSLSAYHAKNYIINTYHWQFSDGGESTITTPSAPLLQITPGNLSLNLTWSVTNDGGSAITSYHVYRGITSGTYMSIAETTHSFFNDTSVQLNTSYYYVVTATNVQGESIYSNQVSAMALGTPQPALTVPSAPALQITAGNRSLYLAWSVTNDGGSVITSYHVYRGTTSGTYMSIAETTHSFFNDTSVQLNTSYYYIVTATNSQGESPYSNEVSTMALGTPLPALTVPSAPTLQVKAGNRSVYLTWNAPNDGGSPILEYDVFGGVISSQYSFIGVTTNLYFNDTSLSGSTKYYFVVDAINAIGEGNYSQELSVTPYGPTSLNQIVTKTITAPPVTSTIPGTTVTEPGSTTTVTQGGSTVTGSSQSSSKTKGKSSPGFEVLPLILAFSIIAGSVIIRKHKK